MGDIMKKKEKIFYTIILVLFIVLSLIVGIQHEPWADEAHAWLIARDTTFYSLFFKYLHTDGHPALWHLILKFFQFIGLEYKYIYIIPIIFSSMGVGVFLFKSNFKWYVKMLLPFSYFIFYQYTIVARGYCLILLLLSLVASCWDDRIKKCYLFSFYLVLLMSCEAYTFLLAGMIYLVLVRDFIKDRKNIENGKSVLVCLIILAVFFILTVLYVCPIPSNTFESDSSIYYISDSFFTNYIEFPKIKLLCSFFVVAFVYWCYEKESDKNKFFEMIFFLLPVFCFMYFKIYNIWHLGILLLMFLFVLWIQKFNTSLYLNVFLMMCLLTQSVWTVSSSAFDIENNYSSSKDVANFIKKYDYKNLDIYGSTFYESALNPYFEENIFDNWNDDIGFFYWNTKNKYYDVSFLDKEYDIIVASDNMFPINEDFLMNFDNSNNKYNIYTFDAYLYAENFKYENMSTTVFVLKEIDNARCKIDLVE